MNQLNTNLIRARRRRVVLPNYGGRIHRQQSRAVRPFRTASLLQLVTLIVEDGSREALHELHQYRTVFRRGETQRLRLAEFLDQLRRDAQARRRAGEGTIILDGAYDLTLDKFSNLPGRGAPTDKSRAGLGRKKGPDCRRYFAAFLKFAQGMSAVPSEDGEAEREARLADLLQRLVHKHFYLSCLECRRQFQRLARRYAWRVGSKTLSIWMPADFTAERCRTWLATNIDDVDARRAHERGRVQGIVDARLGWRRLLSLSAPDETEETWAASASQARTPGALGGRHLAELVAQEKARRLACQRPAIRALGRAKLIAMIRRIFGDLEADAYRDSVVARVFGLSKATLSRFAGSHWPRNTGTNRTAAIPDLWRNTAHVVAAHPDFVDAAEEAGVWSIVAAITGCEE